jgi:hypothetical protein
MTDMSFADRADAAAKAARQTRERAIRQAWGAYLHDSQQTFLLMPDVSNDVDACHIAKCRAALTACSAHLDELARLIAQADGYDDAQSVGPDIGAQR